MSFQPYLKKLDSISTKEGSLADTIKNLIRKRELLKSPMTTDQICEVLYEVTGKRVHNLVPFMKAFQKQGVVRRKILPQTNTILWFGAWDAESVVISKKNDPLDEPIKNIFGKKFNKEFEDLAFVYRGNSGTCSAFMLRKILEKAIFLALIKNGVRESDLKDGSGKYLGLDALLQQAGTVRVRGLPILIPKTLSKIQGIKFLGDVSAHNYLVNVEMDDLKPQMPFIVIGLREIARSISK